MSTLEPGGESVPNPGASDRGAIDFTGRGWDIFGIWLMNFVFSILTLGIYSFWGRTNIRRYLWQNTRYEDEAFEYTGTGGELFIGFLIVVFVVLLPLSAVNFFVQIYTQQGNFWVAGALQGGTYAAILFLVGVATHRVRRYRLSRTLWRGIRGALGGSSLRYGAYYFGYFLLNILSLGLTYPYTTVRLWSLLANDTWLGSGRFHFEASAKPLYRPFMVMWGIGAAACAGLGLLTLLIYLRSGNSLDNVGPEAFSPIFGVAYTGLFLAIIPIAIAYMWFAAARYRLFASGTTFAGDVAFKLDLGGGKYLGFSLFNFFLQFATLGFASSFILIRGGRLVSDRLQVIGEPDYETISQSTAEMPRFGEGLGEAFDVGGF